MKSIYKFFSAQLEIKVVLAVVLIVIIIAALALFNRMSNFNNTIENINAEKNYKQINL